MKLIITIDTEEDNWGNFSPQGYSLKNIEEIPSLQELFNDFNILPTYLMTYPVAIDPKSTSILRGFLEKNQCEIGSHCHPWNTPPFKEETNEKNSMLCNLPEELQLEKLSNLHEVISRNFGISPVSFRAGRWGYNRSVANCLEKLGYRVDTSILPFTDWTNYYGVNFSNISLDPYYFNSENIFEHHPNGHMLEVPATIGFLQRNFERSNELFKFGKKKEISRFRLIGLFRKIGLLNKVWLSPENSSVRDMIALTRGLMSRKIPVINLFFHSPSLLPGLTPFVNTESEKEMFMRRIKEFLIFTKEEGIQSIRLSDALSEI